MFGVSTSQVFASRWKALLWAAGVMLTAYCTVPAAEETPAPATNESKPSQQELDAQKVLRDLHDLQNR